MSVVKVRLERKRFAMCDVKCSLFINLHIDASRFKTTQRKSIINSGMATFEQRDLNLLVPLVKIDKLDLTKFQDTNIKEKTNINCKKQSVVNKKKRLRVLRMKAKYNCLDCPEQFSNKRIYLKHKRIHDSTDDSRKPHQCSTCHKIFPKRKNLRRHKLLHADKKPFSCDVCGREFIDYSSMRRHKWLHTGKKPYHCKICGKSFPFESYLTNHNRTHTGVKPYSCPECDQTFSRSVSLLRHKKMHSAERPYSCEYCSKRFKTPRCLSVHTKIHTGERRYICETCGKGFITAGALGKHKPVHARKEIPKPFKCGVCQQSFFTHVRHRKQCPKATLFSCNVCGERLTRIVDMFVHRRMHTGRKHLMCDFCGKKDFPTARYLRAHVNVHTKEKIYRCDSCVMSFTSEQALKRHKRAHCKKLGKKQRKKCNVCDRSFCRVDVLRAHQQQEHSLTQIGGGRSGYVCGLCRREFSTFNLLEAHKEYHTGERESDVVPHNEFGSEDGELEPTETMYGCFECGEEFSLANDLVEHDKLHKI